MYIFQLISDIFPYLIYECEVKRVALRKEVYMKRKIQQIHIQSHWKEALSLTRRRMNLMNLGNMQRINGNGTKIAD